MADRVNTKFVVILIVVLVAVTSVVGIGVYLRRPSVAQLLDRGDRYLDQGQVAKAIEQYGRALKSKQTDPVLMLRYIDAVDQVHTSDTRLAQKYLGFQQQFLNELVTQNPDNEDHFERLMQLWMKFNSWDTMLDRCQATLRTRPDHALAKRYRGIAQVHRVSRYDLTPEQRLQAREDLEQALEHHPENRQVLYHLARWHVWEAQLLDQPGNDPRLSQRHRQEAERLARASLEAQPDDPQRKIDLLVILLQLKKGDSPEVTQLARSLEQQIIDNPSDVQMLLQCSTLLPQVGPAQPPDAPAGLRQEQAAAQLSRAQKILQAGLEANPDSRSLMIQLGRVLQTQGHLEEASAVYKQAYDLQAQTEAFEAFMAEGMRVTAALHHIDLLLAEAERAEADKRDQKIAEAQALVQEVGAGRSENGEIELRHGKIAILKGDWRAASKHLERANSQLADANSHALMLSAKVWQRLGQPGAAVERLEKVLRLAPRHPTARQNLARLYLSLREFDLARQLLAEWLEADPGDMRAVTYQAQLLAMTGRIDEAIEIYQRLDPQQNPELLPQLARFYLAAGQRPRAIQLLEDRFQEDPTDLTALMQLLRMGVDDPSQANAYIETARQAGANEDALDVLDRYVQSGTDQGELLEELLDQQNDPVRRYQLLRRMGRDEQARAELARAVKQDPQNPTVIEARFESALRDKDWDQAQTLANQAAAINADAADGMFYYGRLASRQGDYQRAIDSFRHGLDQRPIFSDGWRLLADAQDKASLYDAAAASYAQALEYRPNDVAALRGLAKMCEKLGRHDQALEALRNAVTFAPNSRQLRAQYLRYESAHGNLTAALDHAQTVVKIDPNDANNRRNLAMLLASAGQLDEATQTLDPLLQSDTVGLETIAIAAKLRAAQGDPEGGRQLIQSHVNQMGDQVDEKAWLTLADYLMSIGLRDQASAALRQAITIEDPQVRMASRTLADMQFKNQQFDQAAKQYADLWGAFPSEINIGLRYVDSLHQAARWDEAKQALDDLVEAHGENETVLLLRAAIAQSEGYDAQALKILDRAIEMAPLRAKLYYRRAELRYPDPTQEPAVIDDLNQSLELDPELTAAHHLLANLYARRGDTGQAVAVLRTVLERNPRSRGIRRRLAQLYQENDQPTSLRKLLEDSAQQFPSDPFWPRMQADLAIRAQDTDTALEKLRLTFKLAPTSRNLLDLVDTQLQVGLAREALAVLEQHNDLVSDQPLLKAMRGRALAEINPTDPSQTEAAFTAAVRSSQTLNEVVLVREKMIAAWGEEKTRALLLQLAQETSDGLIELALAEFHMSNKDYKLARWWMDRVSSKVDDSSELKLDHDRIAALLLYYEGRHDETLVAYQTAVKRHPDDLMILNNAADFLTEYADQPGEALPLARRAAQIAPDNPLVLDTLGWALFKNGHVEQGLAALRRSARIRPSAVNSYHLAEILLHRGESQSAELMLNQAQQLAQQANDQQILLAANKRLEQLIHASEELQ